MKEYILNFASGFGGATLGVLVSLWINRVNRKTAAVERMLSLVYPIGFLSWWKPDEGRAGIIFHERYADLWNASASLRAALPWWKRSDFAKARQSYMMMEYYDQIPEDEYAKIFQKALILRGKRP